MFNKLYTKNFKSIFVNIHYLYIKITVRSDRADSGALNFQISKNLARKQTSQTGYCGFWDIFNSMEEMNSQLASSSGEKNRPFLVEPDHIIR